MIVVSPSLLSADFADIKSALKVIKESGAEWVHLDIMDGAFVPNITFGQPVVRSIRQATDLVLDAHMMVNAPERYIEDFAAAGADMITVHYEATPHIVRALQCIRAQGKKAGVALNPGTSADVLKVLLRQTDMVLVMGVNPGFGGQKFIVETLDKVSEIRNMIDQSGLDIDIQVDGGITIQNAAAARKAGANVLVSGTSFFAAEDKKAAVQLLKG